MGSTESVLADKWSFFIETKEGSKEYQAVAEILNKYPIKVTNGIYDLSSLVLYYIFGYSLQKVCHLPITFDKNVLQFKDTSNKYLVARESFFEYLRNKSLFKDRTNLHPGFNHGPGHGLMVQFLDLAIEVITIARRYHGVAYGGFVRGLVEYLYSDKLCHNFEILCHDLDLWFQSKEEANQFLSELADRKTSRLYENQSSEKSRRITGDVISYGFLKENYNFFIQFRDRISHQEGWMTIFSIDVVISEKVIPVSDMTVNCLTYDGQRLKSQHPDWATTQLITQILNREIIFLQAGELDHEIPLYSEYLFHSKEKKELRPVLTKQRINGDNLPLIAPIELKLNRLEVIRLRQKLIKGGYRDRDFPLLARRRINKKFLTRGWTFPDEATGKVTNRGVKTLSRMCALIIDQHDLPLDDIPKMIQKNCHLSFFK